ncbi:protein GLUTAMINE DUMPER 4-like [Cornus florida]|uniref:protein GLUTAMINE DUMPER 4-like n=1 Tax=Cornus florida TaxID=4283 RepID=UPI002899BA85|nr:protein GLUTAMINE DUMPER 4-like [Cornus florida]
MRPGNTTTISANATTVDIGFHRWNSPIPYLFGGLAMMLGVIALALVILAFSVKKVSTSDSTSEVQEEPAKPVQVLKPEMEPKIVIMAGDDIPTYLAKPVSFTSHIEQV